MDVEWRTSFLRTPLPVNLELFPILFVNFQLSILGIGMDWPAGSVQVSSIPGMQFEVPRRLGKARSLFPYELWSILMVNNH